MKSKFAKRTVSLMLALLLVLIPFSAVFAVSVQNEAKTPYILIRGFMSSTIYADKDDPDSEQVWPPKTGDIVSTVFKVLPSLLNVIITKNFDRFSDKGLPIITDLLMAAGLDESGNASNGTGPHFIYPSAEEIRSGKDLEFLYDWRLDPTEIAPELDKFISYVTEAAGTDKVCIECRSFGGVIALTYAGIYGSEKIKNIVFNASAVYGAGFAGGLFNGGMTFDEEALSEFLKAAFAYNKNEKLLNGLFGFLGKIGLMGKVCGFLNDFIAESGDRLMKESLFPVFGCWPSTWAMVSSDAYDNADNFVYNTLFAGDNKYAGLREKAENFDSLIRQNREDILADINENSGLYIISKHGFCSMFMTDAWTVPGDMVLECEDTSFGATVAPYGKALGDAELAGTDAEYISPAKNINASTCLYPEQTWFIENVTHSKVFDEVFDFTKKLLYSDEQLTVAAMKADGYARFMYLDKTNGKLIDASAK